MTASEINDLGCESGVIATLIHHPTFSFYSENLLPNHFTNNENRCVYTAITMLVRKGIETIDAYNIMEILNSNDATRTISKGITIDNLVELIEMSDVICRNTPEEYMMLVNIILDSAFRRDIFERLKDCQNLCCDRNNENFQKEIYTLIDDVMTEFSSTEEIPSYDSVIDECWKEIKERQDSGYAGIPFKFKTLNDYVTIEKGELVVFAAEAKQGKSMFLLNCAIDLLKKGNSVLYLDSELNTRMFTARVLSHITGIEYRRLTTGKYSDTEEEKITEAISWLKTRNFTHLYIPSFDLQSIYTAVKKIQHTVGLDVLIVDYFKSTGDGDAWTSYAELGKFVDMVKNQIAGDLGIAAIGAAQATSTGKVADSAKIGRNASTICLITDKTPEEIEADGVECGNKKLRVVLNRNGSQHSSDEYIDLQFNGNLISYEEAKQHIHESPY